jgi:hypothetical protein
MDTAFIPFPFFEFNTASREESNRFKIPRLPRFDNSFAISIPVTESIGLEITGTLSFNPRKEQFVDASVLDFILDTSVGIRLISS